MVLGLGLSFWGCSGLFDCCILLVHLTLLFIVLNLRFVVCSPTCPVVTVSSLCPVLFSPVFVYLQFPVMFPCFSLCFILGLPSPSYLLNIRSSVKFTCLSLSLCASVTCCFALIISCLVCLMFGSASPVSLVLLLLSCVPICLHSCNHPPVYLLSTSPSARCRVLPYCGCYFCLFVSLASVQFVVSLLVCSTFQCCSAFVFQFKPLFAKSFITGPLPAFSRPQTMG